MDRYLNLSTLFMIFFLFGCGGGSNQNSIDQMTLSDLYIINPGLAKCISELAEQNDTPLDEITFLGCGNDFAFKSLEGVENLTNLEIISLNENALSGFIDIPCEMIPNLVELNLSYGRGISGINVSECYNLETFIIEGNNVSEVDLSSNENLIYIDLSGNDLAIVRLPHGDKKYEININNTGFNLDGIERKELVKRLEVRNNQLTNIDLSNFTNLISLDAWSNDLTEIDTTNNVGIERLILRDNNIENLDFSNNANLKEVNAIDNPLSTGTIAYLDSLESMGVVVIK